METLRTKNIEPFPRKFRAVIRAGAAGVFSQNPPREINNIFVQSYDSAISPYRSPRAYSNPPLEVLEHEVIDKARNSSSKDISVLPWTKRKFSQGYHLALMESFTDFHRQRIPIENVVPKLSRRFVDQVVESSDQKDRQITIPEQLSIALDLAEGSILGASVIAHAGSRSIARGSDTRLDVSFRYSTDEIAHWRDCVSSFEAISGNYSDPAADTYHFWGVFTAGLLSETKDRKRDRLFNPIYRVLYNHMGTITDALRYKVSGKTGEIHSEADMLGYHLGSKVGFTLAS